MQGVARAGNREQGIGSSKQGLGRCYLPRCMDSAELHPNPKPKPRYTLKQLLEASDYSEPQPPEEREWVDAPAVGGELL